MFKEIWERKFMFNIAKILGAEFSIILVNTLIIQEFGY